MAAGSKTKIAVTTHVEGVRLDLTPEEAQFLADVMYKVGGDPTKSRRRHQEPISDALRAAGVRAAAALVDIESTGLYFKNDKEV